MNRLAGKIAVITGGGRGIGRAVALAFAREGADVIVMARTEDEVRRVAEEVRAESGVRASHAVCDVADAASVERGFALMREQFGRAADILVSNAGIAESAPFARTSDDLWRRHIEVNLSGTFYCMRAALPAMVERGWGRVINVASIAGKMGAPYIAAYAASKHGVLGLTRSAALEVATRGVTVNAICPGYVETDMTERAIENITARTGKSAEEARSILEQMSPQQRLVTSEEVAALALLLAGHEGRGINGQAINVDGGSVLF
ncbi:MAG TPA: 3-oxoacyl-ACP reductase FabG [Pyrinomonadaceae bacterium]|nr:3-oxoacyl-ACP reductase FabG [Pyrinomonadaceae bacterium]